MTLPSEKEGRVVTAYVAVGSNIDPARNLPLGLELLMGMPGVRVDEVSPLYESAPLERPSQPRFVNGVWRLETKLSPGPLKRELLREVERMAGRVRGSDPHAAREIDLDLVLYGDSIFASEDEGLRIPDPDLRRPFVAAPLSDIARDLEIPGWGITAGALSDEAGRGDLTPLPELTEVLRRLQRKTR